MTLLARVSLMVLFAAGCSRYGQRVPDDVLKKLPYEIRIELLEAENDLAIAIDRVDEAENEIDRTRASIRRSKDRLGAAENEVGRAPDAPSKEVAKLAVGEAEARLDYLRARQDLNVELKSIQELALDCARARFEWERVKLARKAKVDGAEKLPEADFAKQVQSCDKDVAERRQELKPQQQRAQTVKDKWDEKRNLLVRKTFDARASPFVE